MGQQRRSALLALALFAGKLILGGAWAGLGHVRSVSPVWHSSSLVLLFVVQLRAGPRQRV
jgi:hypothetical protein